MKQRTGWTVAFLGLTGLVLGMELWASPDNDADTVPWTDHITEHSPVEVTFAGIGALGLWLIVHFARRYQRKKKEQRTDQ